MNGLMEFPQTEYQGWCRTAILLVEDDRCLREVISHVLRGAGYEVLDAANAEEAQAKLHGHPFPVRLLLTDLVMPGKSGRQLADDLRDACAELKVILMTGYPQGAADGDAFLAKPFTVRTLLDTVQRILSGADIAAEEVHELASPYAS